MNEEEKSILVEMAKIIAERDDLRVEVSRLYMDDIRKVLGVPEGLSLLEGAKRVTAAHDEALRQLESNRRIQARDVVSIRALVNAQTLEDTFAAVRRVVAERNEALHQCEVTKSSAENFRGQSDSKDCMISNIRSILGHPNVSLEEAARTVVQERDVAKAALRGPAAEFIDMKQSLEGAKALRDAALKTRSEALSERDAAKETLADLRICLAEVCIHLKVPEKENVVVWAQRVAEDLDAERKRADAREDTCVHWAREVKELKPYRKGYQNLLDSYHALLKKARLMVQVPFNCDIESLFAAMDRYAARYSDRNNITDALGMPNTATHAEVLAECIAAWQFQEDVRKFVGEKSGAGREVLLKALHKDGFCAGDLVMSPEGKVVPIARVARGHAGYWYVYLSWNGGGFSPENLARKPIAEGDRARCVSGPYKGEFVKVVGVDRHYVEMVREGCPRVHVLDKDMVVAVSGVA